MLRILRQRLPVELDGPQAWELERQTASLNGLIGGVRREYFRRLGLEEDEIEKWLEREQAMLQSPLVAGDVVFKDRDTVLYYRVPRGEGYLEAGIISRGEIGDYMAFFEQIRKAVKAVAGRDAEWQPAVPDADAAAAAEGGVLAPSPKEVEASRELENETAQKLLGQILSSGSIFFNKLSQGLSANERTGTEKLISRFEDLGVVSKDFAVLCRKTGQQILRVSSRAAIEDPSQKTFKCFICGNSVSEESLDEIITVTDFGRKLLERDYWLVVRLLGALDAAGVPNADVRAHTTDGDLTSFLITINDELYMVVLSNRKFTLEESYLINAHVAAYKLAHVIVVSTEKVSKLMRHHLQQTNPTCEFDFLDSLQNLEDRFMSILGRKEKTVLRQVLANFSALTPVHVQDVLMQRISPDPSFFAQGEERRPAPSRPQPPAPEPVQENMAPPEEEAGEFSMMGEVFEADEPLLTEESQVGPG